MNQVLSLLQSARTSSDPGPVLHSDHMFAELLALHEEMIEQLRLERLGAVGNIEFLTGMIDQHEKAAAMLRAKIENHQTDTTNDGVIVITGEASSAAQKYLVTQFAQGARGVQSVRNNMTVSRQAQS